MTDLIEWRDGFNQWRDAHEHVFLQILVRTVP